MEAEVAGRGVKMEGVNRTTQLPNPFRDAIAYWANFIDKCVRERLDTDRFQPFVALVQRTHRLPSAVIADLLLRPSPNNSASLDPRIPMYLQVLGNLGYVDMTSILRAMYQYSSSHTLVESQQGGLGDTTNEETQQQKIRWKNSYWAEDHLFYALTRWVVEGRAVKDSKTALELVNILSKWIALFTAASAAFATDMLGQVQNIQIEMESARAGLVAVLICLRENPILLRAIARPRAKGARTELAQNLANFVPTLHLGNSMTGKEILDKLEHFRTVTLASLDPADQKKKQAADAALSDMMDPAIALESFVVDEIPIGNTRAGLFIHLNALLCGRPLLDDATFFGYLTNRYHGDVQTAAVDLILGAFDVLANAVLRSSGKEDAQLLRSFLINKVPLLLSQLFPPGFSVEAAEVCLTQALSQIDTNLFPTPSLIFDESRHNNPYTESSREEFCGACVLHGLVNRGHVERILGEMSIGYEPKKYSKDDLVQDYLSQTNKIKGVVADLDKMDGNVGAVCQALVEVIRQLCNARDTSSLKFLCTELVQKPQSLDILLLFEKLPTILGPLCQLLDKWRYEDDQAEYQPVYEEFGAILLLVLAFANRYNLSTADIGLYSPTSSVRKILNTAHLTRDMSALTERENQHLGGWIHGLFDTDGGGLGDDLMSSCPPQEFYLIVAPLFYNIVVGSSQGFISDESLKSGVEYLVDTFLLPSLVPALKFLAEYLWVDQKEQMAVIKILQLILLPSAISNEASAMLASVKKVIAKPLEHALRAYQKRYPKNEDITPLLGSIKDSLPFSRRTGTADVSEVEPWAQAIPSGMSSSIRLTIQALIQWAAPFSLQASLIPAAYTHRQFITGIKLMTAKRVLAVVIAELQSQTVQSKAASPTGIMQPDDPRIQAAYDVAVAIVCGANVTNEPPTQSIEDHEGAPPPELPSISQLLSLREALAMEAQGFQKIQRKDPVMAEIIVRLHRRVEAQMAAMTQAAPMVLQAPDTLTLDMDGTAADVSLGEAMAAIQAEAGVGMGGLGDMTGLEGMDGMEGLEGLGGGGGVGGMGVGDLGDNSAGEADMFGELGGTSLDDFDWGTDMDMA